MVSVGVIIWRVLSGDFKKLILTIKNKNKNNLKNIKIIKILTNTGQGRP